MKKQEFDTILKDNNLTRQEFADLTQLSYGAVSNWNDDKKPIPKWVKSWLENYIQMRKFETVKKTLRDSGVCEG